MGGIERFGLPKQGGVPASQAVKADGWLFVAGQVPKNAEGEFVVGGIAEQARQTLDNLITGRYRLGYLFTQGSVRQATAPRMWSKSTSGWTIPAISPSSTASTASISPSNTPRPA